MALQALELLAPARDAATAREAILHGADAVYIGGPSHGARAAASNNIEDIASLTAWAHIYGAKVYVTLNTIIYDDEIKQVEKTVRDLYQAGVDALIVQDMGILRMDIPPIDLHASTQCDIRTVEKAKFLADCGFSQLVLPRELSIDEIKAIREALDPSVKLEAFVHGALCVSYSGDCQASCVAKGRSANRGECAQMCRLPYNLTDEKGEVIMRDKHLLSLRDLNRLADIPALVESGISSFKIEGRLKDVAYVKTTVAAYRKAIDRVIERHPDLYCRASRGVCKLSFTPDVEKAFNRGFTSYFLPGRPLAPVSMANLDTPKWVGMPVGKVIKNTGNTLTVKLSEQLNNGDGLGYFTAQGEFAGFRVNRVEGDRLYLLSPVNAPAGAVLYRNRDVKADAQMSQSTAQRLIPVDIILENDGTDSIRLTISTEDGVCATTLSGYKYEHARSPQTETRKRALSKLGGTPFVLRSLTDKISDDAFIPASVITDLRQGAVVALMDALIKNHKRRERLPEKLDAQFPEKELTYHHNVANRLAETFYREHGVEEINRAIETIKAPKEGVTVMTTRYCVRRELGACLMEQNARKLPQKLYLTNDSATYRLAFDCKNCQMQLITAKKP